MTSGEINRRKFIKKAAIGAAAVTGVVESKTLHSASAPQSWRTAGGPFSNYGQPRADRSSPIRWISNNPSVPGDGVSWSPLHELEGAITPNGLHFERHHNGVPAIDADQWELQIAGLTDRALGFSLDTLKRYPMQSKIAFIECGGNSNAIYRRNPVQAASGYIHGLVSCAEWTGVSLAALLEEAGVQSDAGWLIVDSLDAGGVTISLPLVKAMDDVIVALYQNGEPLRSEHGYPARLLVPGWEGIVNIKWLKSITLSDRPVMSKFDTVSYTDLHADGIAERFSFEMKVKSVITSPSPGQQLKSSGFYEISGLAWTGNGKVERVEVSTDGGRSWANAPLQQPVLDKALTRFRFPWRWDKTAAVLQSRAYDGHGNVQPTRDKLLEQKGSSAYYHNNAITSWAIADTGSISHVYV